MQLAKFSPILYRFRTAPRKAFTFIELIIVIVIIAILAAISVPKFRGTFDQLSVKAFTKDIYYLTQLLRSYAISKGGIYCLSIKQDTNAISWVPGLLDEAGVIQVLSGRRAKIVTSPKGARLVSLEPSDQDSLFFYPNGTVECVAITFHLKDVDYLIETNPLTAHVTLRKL